MRTGASDPQPPLIGPHGRYRRDARELERKRAGFHGQ
jgi:hypothetical protein